MKNKPRQFVNISNLLGQPVDENISEKKYTDLVSKYLKDNIKRGEIPSNNLLIANRKVTNDLTRAYLNDVNPALKLPEKNDITTYPQINGLFDQLKKDMHNSNSELKIRGADIDGHALFQPRNRIDVPDKLAAQFVPNKITLHSRPELNNEIPETLLHELTHAKDDKEIGTIPHINERSKDVREPYGNSIARSLENTSRSHFSNENLPNLYKFPFNSIKDQLLNKITDADKIKSDRYMPMPREEE